MTNITIAVGNSSTSEELTRSCGSLIIKGVSYASLKEWMDILFTDYHLARDGDTTEIFFRKPDWIKRRLRASKDYHSHKVRCFFQFLECHASYARGTFTCYHPFNGKRVDEFSINTKRSDYNHLLEQHAPHLFERGITLHLTKTSPLFARLVWSAYVIRGILTKEELESFCEDAFEVRPEWHTPKLRIFRSFENGFLFRIDQPYTD
ncbi:hypothetical protein IMZ31_23995 (plasmid) [Pontibacillus sp. ALD_SL1]|uniref:hypothetical protein n=1 Tax=Pontibacillus sp. ALD_SL1 TaxID=2777185 RepID=UPI001A95BA5C|nr:hypothetical protein [Pontibacillus sp. ALD_SL1]QST02515.1 hypothetical protein IMZ31_23995 [Pontibacillus sp. ALD_SL1]